MSGGGGGAGGSWGWKLQRLRAMDPAELVHRAKVSARDLLLPPAYAAWTPRQAFDRLYRGDAARVLAESRWHQVLRVPGSTADLDDTVAAARALGRGEWTLFGRRVRLDDPPRWNADPLGGGSWPDAPSRTLDYRRADVAGGVKGCWEVGRTTFLPTLALAGRAAAEAPLLDRAARWLDDWTAANPLGRGIHHTSGIEMAVRVVTQGVTLALVGSRLAPDRLAAALGLLAQQALHCRDHLSLGSSANNHLIAEYAAMTVMGGAFPALRDGERLLADGHRGLVRETLRQVHPDGVPAEQAFGYLPFVWELLLAGFAVADAAGRETPPEVRERLRASLAFARAIRLADGSAPRVGDEDDGRVLLADAAASRLDLVGGAVAAWLDAEAPSDRAPALARLLTGRAPRVAPPPAGRLEFPDGGWTVWRHGAEVVTFDHGPLGLGTIAAHGHADALAITVTRGTDLVIVDPGTFAYQEDAEARDRCRATPAHATVHFGGRSQSEMLGPFLWGRRARVADDEVTWWTGERHARRLEVTAGRIAWTDLVRGRDATLVLPLGPGAAVTLEGARTVVRAGGTAATITATGLGSWRVEPGEFAPGYRRRVPASRLVAAFEGDTARVEITLADA